MIRKWRGGTVAMLGFAVAMAIAGGGRGDELDAIGEESLAKVAKGPGAKPLGRISGAEIAGLPSLLRDSRGALIVATTDRGNLARMLVSIALRKPPDGKGEPAPVLVLERFDTFEAGRGGHRMAKGREVVLFDGFRFDLDGGLIVPEGQGGDLRFVAADAAGGALIALGEARLFAPDRLPEAPPRREGAGPTPGRVVVPGDFAGRYRLFANGLWSGRLELKVDAEGNVSGALRSDLDGASHPVSGSVAADSPRKVAFRVSYPRVEQDYEGFLWAEGKGAISGVMTMLGQPYGFFALREGGTIIPEELDVEPPDGIDAAEPPGRRVVTVRDGEPLLDGEALGLPELTDRLRKAVAEDRGTWAVVVAPEAMSFAGVRRVLGAVRVAGVERIRLAPAAAAPEDRGEATGEER